MKLRDVLIVVALIWLVMVGWVWFNKRESKSGSPFGFSHKALTVVSRDGVPMGQIFDLQTTDGTQDNARILGLIRSFLSESLYDSSVGGMTVQITIDSELQNTAKQLVDQALETDESLTDIGLVVLENSSGGILALVGGRLPADFVGEDNLVIEKSFKVGSMCIPFVYSAAIDRGGLLPETMLADGDKRLSASEALVSLDRELAALAGSKAGEQDVERLLKALYFKTSKTDNVTRAVNGDFDCTLMTLTSAYSTLGASGKNYSPYTLEKIENYKGKSIFVNRPRFKTVFSSKVPVTVAAMIGAKSNLHTVSSDNWCVSFTNKVTIGLYTVDGSEQSQAILKSISEQLEALAAQRGWAKSLESQE